MYVSSLFDFLSLSLIQLRLIFSSFECERGLYDRIRSSWCFSCVDCISYILHVKLPNHSRFCQKVKPTSTIPNAYIHTTKKTIYHKLIICLTLIPITPPPFPSQPGIAALQTGHLATFSPAPIIMPILTPLCKVVLTAVNKQDPQHTCPQGVSVAFEGGKKHIGQVYSDNGSS